MAGAGDELAAGTGDRNGLRASDADREQAVGVLRAAFVHGRLTMDECAPRVTRAYAKAQRLEPAWEPDRKKLMHRGTAVGAGAGMVIPAVAITMAGGPLCSLWSSGPCSAR